MSLPTLSSGSISTTRKSGWRWLPEIHASRLSVSGSLRPKLGLLILSILLLISLCFVLVPVLSKLPSSSTFSPRDLPLQRLYNELSLKPGRTVLLTPEIILSATTLHNASASSCGLSQISARQIINSSAVVFLNQDHGHSFHCSDDRIRVISKKFGTEVFIKTLENEFVEKETLDYSELKQKSKSVIITKSGLNLQIPGALRDGNLVVNGQYQVVIEKDRTIVKIDNLEPDLELFLIQPHGTVPSSSLTSSLLEMSHYGRSRVEIILPTQLIHSSLSLSSKLASLGITDKESSVYHQASLRFLPQANTVKPEEQEKNLVTRLVLLEKFMFILRQKKTESVIMFGNVFRKSA